jgi:hypothetical protein
MKQNQQTRTSLPFEYWAISGIALSASGMFYYLIFIVGLYFLFKRIRPSAGFPLLTVTSIFVGISIPRIYALLVLESDSPRFGRMAEPAIIGLVAVALFFTQKRGLAWVLVVYSAFFGLASLVWAVFHGSNSAHAKASVVISIISFVELWLLLNWIRYKPALSTPQDLKPDDTAGQCE